MAIELNEQNFEAEVLNPAETRPVLVDFWAAWCGPCRAQAPILDQIDETKVKVCKVNTDQNPNLCIKYAIASIPTLIIFKGGEKKQKLMGLHSLKQIMQIIESV